MTLDTATIPEALRPDVRTLWEHLHTGRSLAAHVAAVGEADRVIEDLLAESAAAGLPDVVLAARARLVAAGYGR